MKRKWLSALVLSTLMMKSPLAMEVAMKEESLEPPHKRLKIEPTEALPEKHLLRLPDDLLHLIFEWCHPSDFLALKKTCKKFYQIASHLTFYLAENPGELLEQLKGFIDQKNQTFRLNALFSLMVRTKDVGRRLYRAGEDYVFDPQNPTKEAQLKGLALWLAECAGHKGAKERRKNLEKSFKYPPDQAFFHLLPTSGGLDAKLFDSYKLMVAFFVLSKKLAQSREKDYMNYGDPLNGPPRFRDILKHVSGVSLQGIPPGLDQKTGGMVSYFHGREIVSCAEEVLYLSKVFKKRKGTKKEFTLVKALENAADYAKIIFHRAIDQVPAKEKKKALFLKLAALQEKAGQWIEAAKSYAQVARFSDDRGQKRTYFLKAASFLEESGDMRSMASVYSECLAPCCDNKRESAAYFVKAAVLYEEFCQKREAAKAYRDAYLRTSDKTQKKELFLKMISLHEEMGDNGLISDLYLTLASLTPDNAEKEEAAKKSFSFAEKAGTPVASFMSSLFLSFYADDTEQWIKQRDAAWQKIDKNPANKKDLSQTVEFWKRNGHDDLADKLRKFIDQRWPKA